MPDKGSGADRQGVVSDILKGVVQGVVNAGASPEAIRQALGIDESRDLLHVQNASVVIEINTLEAKAAFVKESGPSWVQYIDHRPHAELENIVLPEFDSNLKVNIDMKGSG